MDQRTYQILLFLLASTIAACTIAQPAQDLKKELDKIVSDKQAKIGYSIVDQDGRDSFLLNSDDHFAMQSVFKVHIAIAVLAEVDRGAFQLDQLIQISMEEMLPDVYSPIRDQFPEGTILTLAEIIEYAVSKSDNIACDILLTLLGGPSMVEDFFRSQGFDDISIKINEEVMQQNWDLQFLNWTTPTAATKVLASFYQDEQAFLSDSSRAFLWTCMRNTETGKNRLKGLLPNGTVVAHKTGWSGMNEDGITEATNNIGIVFLPDNRHFYISVFVTHSKESFETNERIIAEIAKAAYDYFSYN